MDVTIFAGKGGVGKSTSAAAYALGITSQERVLLIDYDGGHSLARVLSLDGKEYQPNKIYRTDINNLEMAIVDPMQFDSISKTKKDKKSTADYLSQFKGDYGLLPFCDMITEFFGAPTDVSSVSKFASLVDIYHQAKVRGVNKIVIDVEPTAGLQRLLEASDSIGRSLQNLQRTGTVTLAILGAKWPDIAQYLKGEFISGADIYTDRLQETANLIRTASYYLVTIPESSPIEQMGDVTKVVTSYGGKITGYVINNIRHEPHEAELMLHVRRLAKGKQLVKVPHDIRLCESGARPRRAALREVGKLF